MSLLTHLISFILLLFYICEVLEENVNIDCHHLCLFLPLGNPELRLDPDRRLSASEVARLPVDWLQSCSSHRPAESGSGGNLQELRVCGVLSGQYGID